MKCKQAAVISRSMFGKFCSFSTIMTHYICTEILCCIVCMFRMVDFLPDAKNDAGMMMNVQATDEKLTAPRYQMQISAQLAFSYTKLVLLAS